MKIRTIEQGIILVLWTGAILTFGIALAMGYSLFITDIIGLAGLATVTIISRLSEKHTLNALAFLLLIGMFNLVSFVYFFDLYASFGIIITGIRITPGIQLYSLIIFGVLASKRGQVLMEKMKKLAGVSKEDKAMESEGKTNMFRKRFERLTDQEIENKLALGLAEEARLALLEIQQERASRKIKADEEADVRST